MIRIISNWSHIGGSTTAFINLCNLFNSYNIDCIFYGPHDYHLNKCKSVKLNDNMMVIDKKDSIIFHFRVPPVRPPCSNVILSCHETNVFELSKINLNIFDRIHFVAEHQKQYHNTDYPSFIIPNVLDDLKSNPKVSENVAGVIGSVDYNKQTHISIQRALEDGFKDIRLFGSITDQKYFNEFVEPLIDGIKVKYCGVSNDKQGMYDQLTDVYLSSIRECKPMVVGECGLTGTKIHTLPDKNYMNQKFIYSNDEIINMWKKELNL